MKQWQKKRANKVLEGWHNNACREDISFVVPDKDYPVETWHVGKRFLEALTLREVLVFCGPMFAFRLEQETRDGGWGVGPHSPLNGAQSVVLSA